MAWKDPFSTPPPSQTMVWLHRYPPDTPAFRGGWHDTDPASYVCGEDSWIAPAWFIWRWKPLTTGQGAPTPSSIHPGGWRDVLDNPPADQQLVWIRRLGFDTVPLRAQWIYASLAFTTQSALVAQLPWYVIYRWKPAA